MPHRIGRRHAVAVMLLSLVVGIAACGSSGGDPQESGPRSQAIEQLRDFGLTAGQAACVVDEVGADTVVEAADINALTESQQYRDAAKACIDHE